MKNNVYERKGFFLFYDTAKSLDCLTDEQFGKTVRSIIDYCEMGIIPEFGDDVCKTAFYSMKLWADFENERYADIVERRRRAGKKGADARWHNEENLQKEMS